MFRSKSKERKVTPPSPSYMDSKQFANYLAELRNNRINRPGGARPQPESVPRREHARLSVDGRSSLGTVPSSETETASVPSLTAAEGSTPPVSQAPPSLVRCSSGRPSLNGSISSRYSTMTQARDYISERPVKPLDPSEVVPSATYIERGQRWMEKEEAFSLRRAMEDMDVQDEVGKAEGDEEDKRIYCAALNEAAELVWQHQNPGKVPQPGAPYRYKPHLRKNSYAHARTASVGLYGDDVEPTGLARGSGSRSVSGSSSSSNGLAASVRSRSSSGRAFGLGDHAGRSSLDGSSLSGRTPSGPRGPPKSYGNLANGRMATMPGHVRRSSLKRNISGEVEKPFSGDQIWEEPEGHTPEKLATVGEGGHALGLKAKNPLNRVSLAGGMPAGEEPALPSPQPKLVSRSEIHRNPPSQSRNPQYTINAAAETPLAKSEDHSVPRKHGVEIRSDDIRQATSMKLKDRSPKLPTPSAVSDNPSRPIVSFDRDWKAQEATDVKPEEEEQKNHQAYALSSGAGGTICGPQSRSPFARRAARTEQQRRQQQQTQVPVLAISESPSCTPPSQHTTPSIQVDGPCVAPPMPPVPSISVYDIDPTPARPPIPTIVLPGDDDCDSGPSIPIIVTPDDDDNRSRQAVAETKTAARPLPTPQARGSRGVQRTRGHWSPAPSPAGSRATARCHECGHFIEGRFVSLGGMKARFHPACFRCYTCGTALEALEISPEPETHRAARLARMAARAAGETLPETMDEDGTPTPTAQDDGDERLRFYCHLDWHEQFAPRCAHCRTPILGASVVALGRHWHEDHFFCAECGDPFKPGATHIEKDGYAWCVACQTRRTERRAPKCRGCRGPVIGAYVRALGGEWHDACFRCATCAGPFDDGQVFPVEGRGVLCTGCRERELKAF